MKRATFLALALVGASVAPASASFETPEDTVREYLAGLTTGDVERILTASAVDEMRAGYRFDGMVNRLGGVFSPQMPGPVHDPFLADVQQAGWEAQLLGQARMLVYGLLAPDLLGEVLEGQTMTGLDARWVDDLEAALDTSRLSALVVADIALPEPELYNSTPNLVAVARQAAMFGADEATDRVVLFTFEGDLYLMGFRLLRYGDEWKVQAQGSPVGGLSPFGTAAPTTIDEWDELVSAEGAG